MRVPKNHSKDIYFITRNLISDDYNLISIKLFSNHNRKITIRSYSIFSQIFELWSGYVRIGENILTFKLPVHYLGISFISMDLDGKTIGVIKIISNN